MSNSNRDTQFSGFAERLYCEAYPLFSDLYAHGSFGRREEFEKTKIELLKLLAQQSYDLACHVSTHTILSSHGDMNKIPDMPVLPDYEG